MGAYRGPATLVVEEQEFEVVAVLRSYGGNPASPFLSWDGELAGDVDWWDLYDRQPLVTLRVPGRGEGQVLVLGDFPLVRTSTVPAAVKGTGPIPF